MLSWFNPSWKLNIMQPLAHFPALKHLVGWGGECKAEQQETSVVWSIIRCQLLVSAVWLGKIIPQIGSTAAW